MTAGAMPKSKLSTISLASLLFAVGLFLSITAVNLYIDILPIRAFCIITALVLIAGVYPANVKQVLSVHRKLLGVIFICSLIGLIVSIINQENIVSISVQLVEIHMQAAIVLILAGFFVQTFGLESIAKLFLSIWAVTAIFAIGQAVGIDFAWQARAVVGDWMDDPAITQDFYDQKKRVVGLSFSPVHLATQTCLAFAAFFALRFYQTSGEAFKKVDFLLVIGWLSAVAICTISGNRSPLIGLLVFLVIYFWIVGPKWRILMISLLFVTALAIPFLQEFGREIGLRIASTQDGSAVGRSTLWSFGLFLFVERPVGHGLLFDSTAHAASYVHQAIHMDNPGIIRHFSLHNYYLLMLNKYGFLICFLIPLILPRIKPQLWGWLAFTPYLIHIVFHNDGPLNSDFLIWFLIPVFSALTRSDQMAKNQDHRNGARMSQ